MAENILHFGGARFRVNGAGQLKLTLIGLDKSTEYVMLPITMAESPGREELRYANFVSQRARLRMETTETDEVFRINRIVIFVHPLYFDFPNVD